MGMLYSQLIVQLPYPTQSFAGQTVIVTGSNTGLGKEAARHIARLGVAKLILAVRNTRAGEEAKSDIVKTTRCASSTIEVWTLDLSSYDSIKSFATRASSLRRIDVLLENAGIATYQFSLAEGHERTVAVNVIGTFLLAFLLLPKLKQCHKTFNNHPRLTVVSSETHGFTKFEERKAAKIFEHLDDPDKAVMPDRYPLSKLLEVLVIRHIAHRLEESGVILNYLNPGFCKSELAREASFLIDVMKFVLARSTEAGSRTLVASAAAGPESHGKYMSDAKVHEKALSKFVRSDEGDKTAERVWNELSEILEAIQPGVTHF